MSKIYLLDKITFDKFNEGFVIRLIKRYNITLFNFFPKVLDDLIKEYVNDIIEINIASGKRLWHVKDIAIININASNQYIYDQSLSFTFDIVIGETPNCIYYEIGYDKISDNIINEICMSRNCFMWKHPLNVYMNCKYNISEYMNIIYKNHKIRDTNIYNVTYHNNILSVDNDITLQIINHKLFKHIIVILKCIICNMQHNMTSELIKKMSSIYKN